MCILHSSSAFKNTAYASISVSSFYRKLELNNVFTFFILDFNEELNNAYNFCWILGIRLEIIFYLFSHDLIL